MDIFEYTDLAMRTAGDKEVVANAIAGLNGEIAEFYLTDDLDERREEAGDIFWYASSIIQNLLDLANEKILTEPLNRGYLDYALSKFDDTMVRYMKQISGRHKSQPDERTHLALINDTYKRIFCHEKDFMSQYKESNGLHIDILLENLSQLLGQVVHDCMMFYTDIGEIRQANISKLKLRHPQGFDASEPWRDSVDSRIS